MTKEQLFDIARKEIFGKQPASRLGRIGHRMAVRYYDLIIPEAEGALLGISMPKSTLKTELENAITLLDYPAISTLEKETLDILRKCAANFNKRYEPLLKKLNYKAFSNIKAKSSSSV